MNINNGLVAVADALPGVNRIRAVQRALAGRSDPVYLEIGVSRGQAFQRISADVKIAVDPAFKDAVKTPGSPEFDRMRVRSPTPFPRPCTCAITAVASCPRVPPVRIRGRRPSGVSDEGGRLRSFRSLLTRLVGSRFRVVW